MVQERIRGQMVDDRSRYLLDGMAESLKREAETRVQKKAPLEQRWLEDVAQFEGRYSDNEMRVLTEESSRSKAYINATRGKVLALASKLEDMLLPTDERNFAIDETPVPELAKGLQEAHELAERATQQANEEPDDELAERLRGEAQELADVAARLERERQEAKDRAKLMEDEMFDHLVECDYASESRDVIQDACVLGTGIFKGPIPRMDRVRRNWMKTDGSYELQFRGAEPGDERLVFYRVDPWHFFPSSDAMTFGDSDGFFERHLMQPRDIRRLARNPAVDKDALRDLSREGPQDTLPTFVSQLQEIEGNRTTTDAKRFTFWEYTGPLDDDQKMELMRFFLSEEERGMVDLDPLLALDCSLWFCQNRIVKFGLNADPANDPLYSIYTLERTASRLWGVGIPWIMRQPQAVLNSAWRGMLDNASAAAFPQTEIDTKIIRPAGGDDYQLRPKKVWLRDSNAGQGEKGLFFHDVPIHQEHYGAIINLALDFIDRETSINVLTQGDQTNQTQTAGGMAILMNATNIMFRRMVKGWDDGITEPNMTRGYDYLMRYSNKEHIKGDYQVRARGSSVLLVREIQQQNLFLLAIQGTQHPVLAPYLKPVEILRKMVQAMMLAADDVVKTDDEIFAEQNQQQAEGQQEDPEMIKARLQMQLAQMDAEAKLALAEFARETTLIQLAANREMKVEDLAAKLQMTREQSQARIEAIREQMASRERVFAAEAAMESRLPGTGGSGGYLSGGAM